MNLYALIALIGGILSSVFAMLVYLKNRKGLQNRLFVFLMIAFAIWTYSYWIWLTFYNYNESVALVWSRLLNLGAVLVPPLYVHWVFSILNLQKKKRIVIYFGYSVTLLFVLFSFSPYFITGVSQELFFPFWPNAGWLYTVYIVVSYVLLNSYAFYYLIREFRKSSGFKRNQLKFLILGSFLGFGGAAFNFPLMYSVTLIPPIGMFFVPFNTVAFAYASIKYRLMNIRFLFTISILYFLLISVITTVFAFATLFTSQILQPTGRFGQIVILMVVSLIVVIGLDPLKRFLSKITDDIFYKDKIDYQKVLRQQGVIIAKEIDLGVFIGALRSGLVTDLKLKAADVLILRNDRFSSTISTVGKEFLKDGPLVKYLVRHQDIIITDEFYRLIADLPEGSRRRRYQKIFDDLEREGIEMCVPVILEGEIKAIIILGQKQSGDVHTAEDVQFFRVLSPQIAVAIKKAELYEEISKFNIQLQAKVNRATKKLKMTNLELQEANAHLKQLDKAKSEFLSIASHQLRTPVSAVKGYLSMMLEGDFGKMSSTQRKVVSDVFESSSRLARLINVFLNVSRIESGRFKLDKTLVNVNDLVTSVKEELTGQAEHKQLTVTFNPSKLMKSIYIDADKVREVILNLVDNAIKYTPHGSIEIQTYIKDKEFHFLIKDQGLGIRREDVKSLFQKFVRGTGIAQVNTQGSGLGLYIANRVVVEHGGKIWAESEGIQKGSTFHFWVPVVKPPKKTDKESGT